MLSYQDTHGLAGIEHRYVDDRAVRGSGGVGVFVREPNEARV